jgi:hypothetical protein
MPQIPEHRAIELPSLTVTGASHRHGRPPTTLARDAGRRSQSIRTPAPQQELPQRADDRREADLSWEKAEREADDGQVLRAADPT